MGNSPQGDPTCNATTKRRQITLRGLEPRVQAQVSRDRDACVAVVSGGGDVLSVGMTHDSLRYL